MKLDIVIKFKVYLFFPFIFLVTPSFASCPGSPPALQDLYGNSFYIDENHSIIDPALKAQDVAAAKPFIDFFSFVSKQSDEYVKTNDHNVAQCGLSWLQEWAMNHAMLGQMHSSQAHHLRRWNLANASLSYLKLKSAASPDQIANIEPWLLQIANEIYTQSIAHKVRNNHYYWLGLALMATSVASDNQDLLSKSKTIFFDAINDIQDDGSLPLEMKRAGKALAYHNFSVAPLTMMAELSLMKGLNWYEVNDKRIELLMKRVIEGLSNPQWFEEKTGKKQEIPQGSITAWMLFGNKRNPILFTHTTMPTKFINDRLGGNLLLLSQVNYFK